ncbi:MAG: CBS domain-containing protein [Candidatus Electrothrix aestuarii]|uniref:CBS domain-containing protein n=1 Tax=Candidatus Electrothrix aestuarii TaxID=3062594 RepID=A0AAU8LUX7_9BACT|nr:CBS domain-containing protein [Candidatus Electrothrix aestuarii]WPD20846.1 MAG: CBS domain-containing protein [Candidatus Electrothrix sp. GW3-3]
MLRAQDLMTENVIAVTKNTEVRELAKILTENKISGVPVLDEAGKLAGVVTESDLIFQNKKVHIPTAVAILDAFFFLESPEKMEKEMKKMAGVTVGEIYASEVISVQIDTPLDEIATLMAEKNIHTLPVVDQGNLVGVIGKRDIIRTIAEGR